MSGIAPTYEKVTSDVDPSTMGSDPTGHAQGGSGQMTGQVPVTGRYETSNYSTTGNNDLQSRYVNLPMCGVGQSILVPHPRRAED